MAKPAAAGSLKDRVRADPRSIQLHDVVARVPELSHAQLAELASLELGSLRSALYGRRVLSQSALDVLMIRLGFRDPRADLDRVLARRALAPLVDLGPHVTGHSLDHGMPRDINGMAVLIDQLRQVLREQRERIARLERAIP